MSAHKYELMLIANPELDEHALRKLVDQYLETVTNEKGTVDDINVWGRRKLAYEINGLTDGDYTLIDFQTEPEAIAELDRVLHIMDAVVRYMIVRRDDRLDSVENA